MFSIKTVETPDRVEVRVQCKPVRFLHKLLTHSYPYGPCFVSGPQSCWNARLFPLSQKLKTCWTVAALRVYFTGMKESRQLLKNPIIYIATSSTIPTTQSGRRDCSLQRTQLHSGGVSVELSVRYLGEE